MLKVLLLKNYEGKNIKGQHRLSLGLNMFIKFGIANI